MLWTRGVKVMPFLWLSDEPVMDDKSQQLEDILDQEARVIELRQKLDEAEYELRLMLANLDS
jgi:hypothetical protein